MAFLKRLLLPAFLLLIQPLAAQQSLFIHAPDPDGNLRVEAQAMFSLASRGGFLPVRVTIVNKTKNEGKIDLRFTSSSSGRGEGSELRSDFSVTGGAEKTTVQDILVPLFNPASAGGYAFQYPSLSANMSGTWGSAGGNLGVLGGGGSGPSILLSDALFVKNASALDGELSSRGGSSPSYSRSGGETFSGKFDPRLLPDDWRAYSGYDAVAMTDADWSQASSGAHNALLQWNRMGGRLVFYMPPGVDLNSLGIKTDDGERRSMGRVNVQELPASLTLDPAKTVNFFMGSGPVGGPLHVSAFSDRINHDFEGSWPLEARLEEKAFHYEIFVFVLIVFAILVGPVNLFVFAKSGRRHRLFITTPLISLGASALLIGMIFILDGLGGRGYRQVLMEVRPDNSENAAYVQQEQVSRTGVLLGSRFKIQEKAMITPIRLGATKWTRFTNDSDRNWRFEVQNSDSGYTVTGDWFQSRSEQGQFLQAVVPTRGRIESRNEAGAPAFLSTFEFHIETLWYVDPSGVLWEAHDISPGKSFVCQAGDQKPKNEELAHFSEHLRAQASEMFARKGYFVAVTTAAPAIESYNSISWKDTRTVLTGPVVKP